MSESQKKERQPRARTIIGKSLKDASAQIEYLTGQLAAGNLTDAGAVREFQVVHELVHEAMVAAQKALVKKSTKPDDSTPYLGTE